MEACEPHFDHVRSGLLCKLQKTIRAWVTVRSGNKEEHTEDVQLKGSKGAVKESLGMRKFV